MLRRPKFITPSKPEHHRCSGDLCTPLILVLFLSVFPHAPRCAPPPVKSQFAVAVLRSKLQLPATYHWLADHFKSLHPSSFPCCSYVLLVSFLPIIHSWLWRALLSPLVPIISSLFLSPWSNWCSQNWWESLLMVLPSALSDPTLALCHLSVCVSGFHPLQT